MSKLTIPASLVLLLLITSAVRGQVKEDGGPRGLFGDKPRTIGELFDDELSGRLAHMGRSDELATEMAIEEAYLIRSMIGSIYRPRDKTARFAVVALLKKVLRGKRVTDAESQEAARSLRPGGEVAFRIHLVRYGLEPMTSTGLDDAGRAAIEVEVRDEILREENLANAIRRSSVSPKQRDQAAAWIRENLKVRVEFENNREIILGILDNPTRESVDLLDAVMSVYYGAFRDSSVIARTFKDAESAELSELRRGNARATYVSRVRGFHQSYGYAPREIEPALVVLQIHDAEASFAEAMIARASREAGPELAALAPNELRQMAAYKAELDRARDAAVKAAGFVELKEANK